MKQILLSTLFLLTSCLAYAQTFTLSGTIEDKTNGESLIGAMVKDLDGSGLAATNVYGYYSISVEKGRHRILVSILGYESDTVTLLVTGNTKLDISLKPANQEIGEVVILGEKSNDNIKNIEMSVTSLSTKEIQKIPQLLGETDIVRSLTLLPGITTVGEGASGFNVRGGNVDQNLILLDEAPVFNSSHLFGFFSVFNADAVKDVKLYKGGIPSVYGGRLSSVLDVRQKEGNSKHFSGNGGLGLLSSRLTLEGPIVKDKMSFMVAGRRSYMDLFIPLIDDEDINGASLYFYDFNAKVNYKFSDRSRLFASAYLGRDVFGIKDLFNFGWGNVTSTLRWNYLIRDNLFMNLTGVYSDYTYNVGTPESTGASFNLDSRIRNYIQNGNFTWYASNRHKVDFGYNLTQYTFDPGVITGFVDKRLQKEYAFESAIYISDEWNLTDQITVLGGLRYSGIVNYGERDVVNYNASEPSPSNGSITDTTRYGSMETIASYFDWNGFEPRLAINYTLDESQAIKLSYNRTRQYIHLISNTTSPTPVDIWRPAGKYIQPATADQIALGYFKNMFDDTYKISVEGYYKNFRQLVDYKNGADLIFQDNIETQLLSGKGRAYGLEFMLEKKTGRVTGWVSYTLSRSERKVDGPTRETQINEGNWYKANFDKPHDVSVVINTKVTNNWDIGLSFAYQTGRPITYPDGIANYEGILYPIYNNRNGQRVPDYHRLDISATYLMKKTKHWEQSLTFGIYNVYGRHNPYSIFFQQNADSGLPEATQLSIFAAPIPFITYNFNF